MSDLKLGLDGATADAKRVFYSFPFKGKPVGVFAKTLTGKFEPYLWFVKKATYNERYDWYGRAEREVNAKFKDHIDYYMQKALDRLR